MPVSAELTSVTAITHATKATEALAGADDLDQAVCSRLADLVDGLVLRQF
jgi:hypothetical protein